MSDVNKAIAYVYAREGGYANDEADSGKATNKGISLRFLREVPIERLRKYGVFKSPSDLNADDVKELTESQIHNIYQSEFWDNNRFNEIRSQQIANYVFDMAVHCSPNEAIKLLQRAIWAYRMHRKVVNDDGILGPETLAQVNSLGNILFPVLIANRASYYRLLVEIIPKNRKFLNDWLNRAYNI